MVILLQRTIQVYVDSIPTLFDKLVWPTKRNRSQVQIRQSIGY